MKIAIADNNSRKFTEDIIEHWEKLGHEVHVEPGASEKLAQWADIYFIDTWDNNVHYLYDLYHGDPRCNRTPDWDNDKKPVICVRILDWEVWIGLVRNQEIINWVDKAICIAPHIETRLRSENEWGDKLKLIRPGVNLDKFTLKTKQTNGFQLGMVLGDMWWPKNHMGGLDIFTSLYQNDSRWRLHIRGQHEGGTDYWRLMYEHYLKSRGIEDVVTLYAHTDDMNAWYENIDILLHPGMKEAFCYAVGEAMAKGIPAVINNFMGSENIWGGLGLIYDTHEEAIIHIKYNYENGTHRQIERDGIEKEFNMDYMLKEFDEYLQIS